MQYPSWKNAEEGHIHRILKMKDLDHTSKACGKNTGKEHAGTVGAKIRPHLLIKGIDEKEESQVSGIDQILRI